MARAADVEKTLVQFLTEDKPKFLVVEGAWGSGKTYLWRKALKSARNAGAKLARSRLAYISLFGINSLEAFKLAPIENIDFGTDSDKVEAERTAPHELAKAETHKDAKNWRETIARPVKGIWRTVRGEGPKLAVPAASKMLGDLTRLIPGIGSSEGLVSHLLHRLVDNMIICVDDLERMGKGLELSDVLGHLSFLQEQRNCKILLLLNSNALDKGAVDDYEVALEKVVDKRIKFQPTPAEAAAIGVPDGFTYPRLRDICQDVGIVNIRIIRRLADFTQELMPYVAEEHPDTQELVMRAIVILGWMITRGEGSPDIEALVSYENRLLQNAGNRGGPGAPGTSFHHPDDEKLESLNFVEFGDLEQAIWNALLTGYPKGDDLKRAAEQQSERFADQDYQRKIQQAWHNFHRTLEDNTEEVIAGFVDLLKDKPEWLDPTQAVQILQILSQLMDQKAFGYVFVSYVDGGRGKIEPISLPTPLFPGVAADWDETYRQSLQGAFRGGEPIKPVALGDAIKVFIEKHAADAAEQAIANAPTAELSEAVVRLSPSQFNALKVKLQDTAQVINRSEQTDLAIKAFDLAFDHLASQNVLGDIRIFMWRAGRYRRTNRLAEQSESFVRAIMSDSSAPAGHQADDA